MPYTKPERRSSRKNSLLKCTSLEKVQSPVQVQNLQMALKHPVARLPSLGKGLRVVPVVPVVEASSPVAVLSVVAVLIDGETAQSLSCPERLQGSDLL